MLKVFRRLAVLGGVATLLTACQTWDTARLKQVKETQASQSNARIYCSGTEHCEFERLNRVMIMDAESQRLSREAIKQGLVRLQADSLRQPNPLYLSVPAKQHEVVIRFYPISRDQAETLHVIHQFKPRQTYTFKMYRDRSKHKGSLLNVSAPEPLCVDLLQNQKIIRRFCKPYNVLNGLGEFVEQKI
ncbi:hypothetical protein ABFP25_03630 [Acinetobacter indicus]|uniref:hypothetical protein n=1 Tax=Acinetobacter TaxID=469 RepID=UPI0002CE623E|nr:MULTISPECIES: hypothetical protein [Acinetobacter]ENW87118.1 hypothetical protein F905_02817 [Acinetobacter sp. CIP 53.82]MBA0156203.1 hypothetical protein [Acinetobacter indicus]